MEGFKIMFFFRFRLRDVLLFFLLAYLLYFLLSGFIPFLFYRPKDVTKAEPQWVESHEQAVLVDDISEAWRVRLDLIEGAEETLDVAYYAFHGGETVPEFIAYLFNAADRGVKVRLIMDGMSHGMWQHSDYIKAFQAHPNIEFAFYQPIDLMRPWTLEDRMHEKIIIADNKYSLTGGRNIGDKYFTYKNIKNVSIDRDVLLMKTDQQAGLIEEIASYYNALWQDKDTQVITDKPLKQAHEKTAEQASADLRHIFTNYHEEAPNRTDPIDWQARAYPINKGYLVTNSLDSGKKEARVWENMLKLITQAENSVLIQTPYAIPTSRMKHEFMTAITKKDSVALTLLTNSLNATNNLFAFSGYLNHRNDFIQAPLSLYEYQPDNSQIHAKAFLIDEKISVIGSFNFDSRSAHLSTESMLVMDSPEFTQRFQSEINKRYLSQSKLITTDNKKVTEASLLKRIEFTLIRPLTKLIEPLL